LKPIGGRNTKRVKAGSCRSRAAGKDVIPRKIRRIEGYGKDTKQNDILRIWGAEEDSNPRPAVQETHDPPF